MRPCWTFVLVHMLGLVSVSTQLGIHVPDPGVCMKRVQADSMKGQIEIR